MSIPANIVEGYGGQRGRSFVRYLKVSRGSAWEADYWILLAEEMGAIDRVTYEKLRSSCGEVIAMLTSAINKVL
jgi:four helix bundle protein